MRKTKNKTPNTNTRLANLMAICGGL